MNGRDDQKGLAPGMPTKSGKPLPTADSREASDVLGQGDARESGLSGTPGGAQAEIEGRSSPAAEPGGDEGSLKPSDELVPAGPHAKPDLINPDSTPGAGVLTPPGEDGDADAASG